MKSVYFFLLTFFSSAILMAQDVPSTSDVNNAMGDPSKQVTTTTNLGALIGQLVDNLKDEAFTDDFKNNKGSFISSVANSGEPGFLSGALQKLQLGLKPDAMKPGWNDEKNSWQDDARTAITIQPLAGLLQRLEQNIAPSMFKGDWAKYQPMWDQAINGLAGIR